VVVIASNDGLLRVFSTVMWTCVAVCRGPQVGERISHLTSYRNVIKLAVAAEPLPSEA